MEGNGRVGKEREKDTGCFCWREGVKYSTEKPSSTATMTSVRHSEYSVNIFGKVKS